MKLKKVITIIAILFLLLNTVCFADINTNDFKPNELVESDYERAFEMAGTIVNTVTVIGIVVAIVGIILIGIKYMLGSVEEKAEYKKTMIPYIIGCIFIFSISSIVSVIYSLVSQI